MKHRRLLAAIEHSLAAFPAVAAYRPRRSSTIWTYSKPPSCCAGSPYQANLGKRLVKSPKVYLRDSGILHALLGIASVHDLAGHPVVGASWEGWVLEQVAQLMGPQWRLSFYRTAVGAEIDIVAERGERKIGSEINSPARPQ